MSFGPTLVVLRGNSGSGKSTTAHLLREELIAGSIDQQPRIALVGQDFLRRVVLKERDIAGGDNVSLIDLTVRFAFGRGYSVILEGILYSKHYSTMLEGLLELVPVSHVYYFELPFDETLRRHNSKPNAHEFGEAEMGRWYNASDLLGVPGERIIGPDLDQTAVVELIRTAICA